MKLLLLIGLVLFAMLGRRCTGYVPPEVRQRWNEKGFETARLDALKTVQECAQLGQNTKEKKELFWEVKFLDRYASKFYSDLKDREALLDKAKGSWELRLALNSDRDEEFYPHPEFRSFAMAFITVQEDYFGKGIAPDANFCFVALGGPSSRNIQTRQVYMNYEDFFISGRQVPGWDLSYYLRGYQRNWVAPERKRPKLAFTVVCADDKIMVVRGNKTGGMAIFRRIQDDMCPAAYGI